MLCNAIVLLLMALAFLVFVEGLRRVLVCMRELRGLQALRLPVKEIIREQKVQDVRSRERSMAGQVVLGDSP